MKFFSALFLIMILSFFACLYLPWWSIAIVSFVVVALIPQNPMSSFIAGFTAVFILWGALSFYISNENGHILAHRISLLVLKNDSAGFLIVITALIGGLVAGFAALSASYLRPRSSYEKS